MEKVSIEQKTSKEERTHGIEELEAVHLALFQQKRTCRFSAPSSLRNLITTTTHDVLDVAAGHGLIKGVLGHEGVLVTGSRVLGGEGEALDLSMITGATAVLDAADELGGAAQALTHGHSQEGGQDNQDLHHDGKKEEEEKRRRGRRTMDLLSE